MHRFFVPTSCINDNEVVFEKEQAHQMRSVLRLRPGQRVVALDNAGSEYEVELTVLEKDEAAGTITAKRRAAGEPRVHITLFQAMLARDKFELVLQKCTEVGAVRVVPVITERTIARSSTIKENKLTRWRQIVTEAAEQSRRGLIPRLDKPQSLQQVFEELSEFDLSLIACVDERKASLGETLVSGNEPPANIALLIGPEGGFAESEIELAHQRGAASFGLGPRILRTETAAVVATSLILYELGDMDPR